MKSVPEPVLLSLSPVAGTERIDLIDVLRGFAVLGILLVNVTLFFSPIYLMISDTQWWTAPVDRIVAAAVTFVAQGKFYTLFSLLFGVGMALQLERAEAKGLPPDRFFSRRLFWLLAIGLVHAFLIWFGDILVTYAVAGLLMLVLRRLPNRPLFFVGLALLLLPLVAFTAIVGLVELSKLAGAGDGLQAMLDEQAIANVVAMDAAVEAYASGGFVDVLRARAGQVVVVWSSWVFSLPNVLGLFAMGFVVGRTNWLARPNVAAIRRWLPWLAVAGVAGAALQTWGSIYGNPGAPSIPTWVGQLGTSIGGPALCLTYCGTIVLLYTHDTWRRRLQPLADVGRMALTNYLMHSIVFTTIALPWVLGLYGEVPPSIAVPAGIALYLLQIPLSGWWLSRFRFGPAEWLWRSLTYGSIQPLRRR